MTTATITADICLYSRSRSLMLVRLCCAGRRDWPWGYSCITHAVMPATTTSNGVAAFEWCRVRLSKAHAGVQGFTVNSSDGPHALTLAGHDDGGRLDVDQLLLIETDNSEAWPAHDYLWCTQWSIILVCQLLLFVGKFRCCLILSFKSSWFDDFIQVIVHRLKYHIRMSTVTTTVIKKSNFII